jgi:two-component system CheB/CheR fusion protein
MSTPFPIVAIGASAGGIDAFHSFFDHMPADSGMAFVMILHLPADRKSMLGEILSRWTRMKVIHAVDDMMIEPNRVYVPPPHSLVTLSQGRIKIQGELHGSLEIFRPIDTFFDSLGAELKDRAVGIVLSGTGSDGALGLKAIKASGGLTIAQARDGSHPQYSEMPEGAIAMGAVDLIATVEEMPAHLLRIFGPAAQRSEPGVDAANAEGQKLEICQLLRAQLGHDFSGYRSATFLRRVARRMQVVNVSSIEDYIGCLKRSPEEITLLFRDLLIRVTSFFRDKETFKILESEVIPKLFENMRADATVRVWVPGCATGEEVYSLAILLREFSTRLSGPPRIQLFATDIDEAAINIARLGRYPVTLVEGLSTERLARFFTLAHGSYVVNKEIRELCTFSPHNLVRDPPFSMMNLVSCRNLLIYMSAELQASVLPIFHYALVPGGILLLGGAESVAQHGELFDTVNKGARIFRKRDVRGPDFNLNWQGPPSRAPRSRAAESEGRSEKKAGVFAANSLSTALFGSNDVLAAKQRVSRFDKILGPVEPSADVVSELQTALSSTCEELCALAEQYQTALEELRSANEELHSVNEEMQSTNEELETSKEELQSLNEELQTVNVRLTEKVSELDRSNSDLRNLFESTEIATVFLDRFLLIRSFTPAMASLYNLIPTDQGRPLTDMVSHLKYSTLREDVATVLDTLQPLERRVARHDGAVHYIVRILPYRDPDNTVSGVLITFVDVTSIVQAETALVEADMRKDVFLATLSHELRNPLAPIRTAARVLQLPSIPPDELKRAQAIITRQVAHMSTLLDDLLDVSRITRGSFVLKKAYIDLRALMEAAVEAVQPAIDRRQHTLRVEWPLTSMTLEADPVRLTQVLTNLLANAAKYTSTRGVITFGTRLEKSFLILFVRDNGVGLAPEMLTKVFTMFAQVESQIGRSEGGLGIGLALAKGLVELHGGRIEARSAGPGKGSEFIVTLPRSLIVEHDATQAPTASKLASSDRRRVLIADDNCDGADSMSMLLSQAGHEVHLAHSGKEALALAQRVRPQIALLDIGMPELNGYQVAERIRAEAWGNDITLIAVTGWGQEDDKRRARAAGFDHHLTKPIDPESLNALISRPRTGDEKSAR